MREVNYYYRSISKWECAESLFLSALVMGLALWWNGNVFYSLGLAGVALSLCVAMQFDAHFPQVYIKVELEGEVKESTRIYEQEPEPSPIRDALMDAAKKRATAFVVGQVKKRF